MVREPNSEQAVIGALRDQEEFQPSLLMSNLPLKKNASSFVDGLFYLAIIASLLCIIYFSLSGKVFTPLIKAGQQGHWATLILRPSMLWALMGMIFLVFRTFLWISYRPFPPASMDDAPSLTVIIPAYNEGPMVKKAIYSVLASNYPLKKLEIMVIDDGSRDDTWTYIKAAFIENPSLISAIRFPHNKGKRAALEEGFRRARGEIIVTLDSDSVIEGHTLLEIVGPFRDPKIGAVAGRVSVFNREQGVIPKMLKVRFLFSFDVLRAAQSTYQTVYCCPGALSAYRSSVVRQVLNQWVNQAFLGTTCTYGEDRAMTNYILSRGYHTVYQRSAQVYTIVPWTYKKLWKMYLRWDRSYVRETIRLFQVCLETAPLAPYHYFGRSFHNQPSLSHRVPEFGFARYFFSAASGHRSPSLLRNRLVFIDEHAVLLETRTLLGFPLRDPLFLLFVLIVVLDFPLCLINPSVPVLDDPVICDLSRGV